MTGGPGFSQDDISAIVPLLGEKAEPIHMPLGSPSGVGGGDVDCLVWRLDAAWPLRLPPGWRLLQVLQYDTVAWYWVIERGRDVIAIDTLADPHGIGQYAWPVRADTVPLGPGQLAAYLATKRLRKGIRRPEEWDRIRSLALEDPDGFRAALEPPFGGRAPSLAAAVLSSGRPDEHFEGARALLRRRRVRTAGRAARLVTRQLVRSSGRWLRPTGLSVRLVGPDGAGKSAVAGAVLEQCAPMFRRTEARHWRPGLLPRSHELTGGTERDATDPHGGEPRGGGPSLLAAAYHWFDFFLAGTTVDRFRRVRSTLLVAERGWEDLGADPLRYRLSVPPAAVRTAARLLPRPDLAFVLRATPDVAVARKPELPEAEIARQVSYWERHPPRGRAVVEVDADRPLDEVAGEVRDRIADALNRRALGRVAGGWAGLPRRSAPRWWVPRAPARSAAAGLAVYQPVTPVGLAGWKTARVLARLGAFSLLPRGRAIPEEVRAALAPHLERDDRVSVMRANHPARFVALLMSHGGAVRSVAKVALDDEGAGALAREAKALGGLALTLPPPLRAPRLLASSPGVCVVEAVGWKARRDPWRLDPAVARALGVWFARGRAEDGSGPSHGDFAPWNLLQAGREWVVVDWESADPARPPFHDAFHYLVQSHALLGRPTSAELLAGLRGEGEIGAALAALAAAAGLETSDLPAGLSGYLRATASTIDPATPDGARAVTARSLLLQSLGV